jgi:cyclophilin family peptidyl-prolyl cis-trans isomerase
MRRNLFSLDRLFQKKKPRPVVRKPSCRLQLESLEDRVTPSAFTADVMGSVVVQNGSGFGVAGVTITLTGTPTTQASPVSYTTTTDANGNYTFQNVLPGDYTLSFAQAANYLPPTAPVTLPLVVNPGSNVTQNMATPGLSAPAVNLGMFLNSTTRSAFDFNSAGLGTAMAESAADSSPFTEDASTTVNGLEDGSNVVDLSGFISDPDLSSTIVEFDTTAGDFDVQLFDSRAPQTVANFLDYVQDGNYDNAIFTRLVSGFVLQGGGLTLGGTSTSATLSPTQPLGGNSNIVVPNEFSSANGSAQNLEGTLAMALGSGNPNSGSKEFFFNLADNSSNLDPQDFTVFGQVIDSPSTGSITADPSVLTNLLSAANFTPTNESSTTFAQTAGVDLQDVPLLNGYAANSSSFPTNAPQSDFFEITGVKIVDQPEALTYSIVPGSNTNPGLVTPTLTNNYLSLAYTAGMTGTAQIDVQATDKDGATLGSPFVIDVNVTTPPPVVNSVTVSASDNTLVANATISDSNGDTTFPDTTYQWYQNGSPLGSPSTSDTFILGDLTVNPGDQFTVAVTPIDSGVSGATVTSKPVALSSTGPATPATPAVTTLTISADNPADATTLTASAAGNEDGLGSVTYTYTWTLSGSDASTSNTITGSTLTLSSLSTLTTGDVQPQASDTLTLTATPSGGGTPYTTANLPLTITAGSPDTYALETPTANAPTITANATTHVLTVSPTGNDGLSGTLGYQYQWLQNGTAIAGATNSTLNLTAPGLTLNVNDAFSVQVTPIDTAAGSPATVVAGPTVTSNYVFVTSTNPLTTR